VTLWPGLTSAMLIEVGARFRSVTVWVLVLNFGARSAMWSNETRDLPLTFWAPFFLLPWKLLIGALFEPVFFSSATFFWSPTVVDPS
jgi:hypothetical protein